MLDIKSIRENPETIRKNLEKRGSSEVLEIFDSLVSKDEEYRSVLHEFQSIKHGKNTLSLKINELKKQGQDASKILIEINDSNSRLAEIEEILEKVKSEWNYLLLRLPNLADDSVPSGPDESSNKEIRRWGEPRKFEFELKSHVEVAENLGIADFDRATKISGAGWYILKGDLAYLNQAIIRFAIDKLTEKGYLLIEPPHMMLRDVYEGVEDISNFENALYRIEKEDSFMIATSEHPLTAMHMNETIDDSQLPLKYLGYSLCFRREIGSHGIDEKGLFRRHQFPKVEQVVFSKPENSWEIHEEMLNNAEELFQALNLPYRVVILSAGDAGSVSAKTYDLEVWSPRNNEYKEAVSCSNVTDYQSRRLNIKHGKQGGERHLVHTLNSTALALTRVLVAILENYQNPDGSVTIPDVLVPYMNGKNLIK